MSSNSSNSSDSSDSSGASEGSGGRPQADGTAPTGGILARHWRLVTLGSFAIVFLVAFENLAVTTIMPVISRELHGASLYAVAFAGPLAMSVVGMVVAGNWSDRTGPRAPLFWSIALFAVGLVIAGTSGSMWALVAGRLVYGLAGGGMTVALYVIVGHFYPASLQPRMFGAFSAAWVVPALVGPAIAGIVADAIGWRWVFLGVVALVLAAFVMVIPAMRGLASPAGEPIVQWSARRIAWSALLAVAVLALSLAGELDGVARVGAVIAALVVALVAFRPLTPAGTLRSVRGLPSVIVVRAIVAGAYFGAEVYLPYLLTSRFLLSPAVAGLSLTGAGIAWGAASWLQGRMARLDSRVSIRLGTAGVALAIAAAFTTSLLSLPAWVAIVGWAVGGAGMGISEPRLAVLMLGYSSQQNRGFNSSAMTIADSVGSGMALALLGILFGVLAAASPTASLPGAAFTAVFLVVFVLALVSIAMSGRVFAPRKP